MRPMEQLIHKGWNVHCRVYIPLRRAVKSFQIKNSGSGVTMSHVTLWSTGNTGDTVLSTCIRDLFDRECGPVSWKLMDLWGNIDRQYIHQLNGTDAVIIGGHGAFLPDTHANDISNWEFACSEQQYDEIKPPIIVFAVGYNYFNGQERTVLFESNIKKLVERSAFFGLRNRGSVREIQSFLPEALRGKVMYQPCPTMISRLLYPELPVKKRTGKVAFNVALDRAEKRMGRKVDMILEQIALAMEMLSRRGYEIHFVAHMNTEFDFIPYVRRLRFPCHIHAAATWDAARAMRFYNGMDVVIGMRGHGIWIPFGVNCQIISLGNQMKTKWFLEDIHALDWFIDVNEQPEQLANQIINKFEEIHEINGEETDIRLHSAQEDLYRITMENMTQIKRILTKTHLGGYEYYVISCPIRVATLDIEAIQTAEGWCGYAA